jgi:hypothetical protein
MSYSPKINPGLVQELYLLKHSNERKTPITKLVNEAIIEYLEKLGRMGKDNVKERKGSV